ncbi:hypothetical protein EVAR_8993_1 [Eumeta japonica]|uniref:Uncharacterized protein n=1 Tax=Eumeta variegata TaxID=151549 RepID=A0A4C1WP05_EUMVA|nr:hypothetical protein EVAR_8993_1 [Eumeta japonica]
MLIHRDKNGQNSSALRERDKPTTFAVRALSMKGRFEKLSRAVKLASGPRSVEINDKHAHFPLTGRSSEAASGRAGEFAGGGCGGGAGGARNVFIDGRRWTRAASRINRREKIKRITLKKVLIEMDIRGVHINKRPADAARTPRPPRPPRRPFAPPRYANALLSKRSTPRICEKYGRIFFNGTTVMNCKKREETPEAPLDCDSTQSNSIVPKSVPTQR